MSSQPKNDMEKLVIVATVDGMLQAHVLRAHLESAGIPALLDYESAGVIYGFTAAGLKLSEVRILVSAADAELARQILDTPPAAGWEEEAESSIESD